MWIHYTMNKLKKQGSFAQEARNARTEKRFVAVMGFASVEPITGATPPDKSTSSAIRKAVFFVIVIRLLLLCPAESQKCATAVSSLMP